MGALEEEDEVLDEVDAELLVLDFLPDIVKNRLLTT